MNSPMDNANFAPAPYANRPNDFEQLAEQARRNPAAFEDYIKRTNPQAYQQAMQIMNCANPRAMVAQMAKARGVNPNILRMFGLM